MSNRVSSRENKVKRCAEILLCLVSGFVIWFLCSFWFDIQFAEKMRTRCFMLGMFSSFYACVCVSFHMSLPRDAMVWFVICAIRGSPSQFENRIKPWVYVRRITRTRSTMYEKAPFC